jgi:hypothetical protein
MAKIGVSLKINVSKIEKARLFKGEKGQYLDATVFIDLDELDQYGNSGMITQDVSKEEKQAGTKGAILGNGKVFWKDEGQAPQANKPQDYRGHSGSNQANPTTQPAKPQYQPDPVDDFEDDIPFN